MENTEGKALKEKLEFEVNNDYLEFETDHFSTYAIVDTDSKIITNVQTGDNISMFVVLFVISILGLMFTLKKSIYN